MRNLRVYPITNQEKLSTLELCQKLLREHVGENIGGIQELALKIAIDDLKNYYDMVRVPPENITYKG